MVVIYMKKNNFLLFILTISLSSALFADYSLGFKSKKFEFPILEWICSQCRHGNSDSDKRCEYCGKLKDS